ncbi:MAG: ComEC/Rec2 family competence protein [Alphaproteobacteria bacterium]|nr:ComEC/Rec2 family competence protein [Alphaproteobacteria bacterium]
MALSPTLVSEPTRVEPDAEAGPFGRLGRRLSRRLEVEREQWPLWLPVGLGAGVALYFALPAEPLRWPALAAIAIAVLLLAILRRGVWALPILFVLTLATGIATSQWRTAQVAAPVLDQDIGFAMLSGRVVRKEPRETGYRLILDDVVIDGLARAQTPVAVRVTVRVAQTRRTDELAGLQAGDRIEARAGLAPPSPPAIPGAYDFQRAAWFQQLGAIGFTYGVPEKIEMGLPDRPGATGLGAMGLRAGFFARIDILRGRIFERVAAVLPGSTGAVAAALMVGERGAIDNELQDAMRRAGLAHLLAISGLHLGLLAGFVFFTVRAALALIPHLALSYPIKKWAATTALAAALFYLFLAGATVPTQRAFIMLALVLGAVLFDRTAISLRLVGWAAAAILLLRPESLVGASFQLSFAAVIALVAVYQALGGRWRLFYGAAGPIRRASVYLAGVALTTIIAGVATAPFALQNFNTVAVYGLAANLVAVPIVALWVMPFAVAAFALMPIGLEALALVPMGWGVDLVTWVAGQVAAWPGAVWHAPAAPTVGFAAIVFGGLWLAVWQTGWRIWGALPLLAGLASITLADPPDMMITGDGALAGIATGSGVLLVSDARRNRFEREVWMRRLGVTDWQKFPTEGKTDGVDLACDSIGCVYRAEQTVVAFPRHAQALAEDCRSADIIIATMSVSRTCAAPSIVIDYFDLRDGGAHAVWLAADSAEIRVRSANETRGRRPWVK